MSLFNLIYNKYEVFFYKMDNCIVLWIYKNNKGYDSMIIYGNNVYKNFLLFVESKELFYDENNETFVFHICSDKSIEEFYEDLYVFEKRYRYVIF